MHAVSDRDSQKCHQGSLGVLTHLMLVNTFLLGSLSSIMLVIAEASCKSLGAPSPIFCIFSNNIISKSGD